MLVAIALAVLPWFAATRHDPESELALITSAALIGLLAAGSGVVAESLDDGWYGIGLLHGLTPLGFLVGEALGAAVGLLVALGAFAILSSGALRDVPVLTLVLCGAWMSVLVSAWLAIMLWLGTLLPGKGNAIAMIPMLVAFAFPPTALPVESWPPALARVARSAWSAMPLQTHAWAIYASLLHHSTPPAAAPIALLLAPPSFLGLAGLRLTRLEAARRLTA